MSDKVKCKYCDKEYTEGGIKRHEGVCSENPENKIEEKVEVVSKTNLAEVTEEHDPKDKIIESLTKSNLDMMDAMKEMMNKIEEMKASTAQPQAQSVIIQQERAKKKSIKIMNLSVGQCHLVDGILNARMDKPFDKVGITDGVFENFYNRFKPWFDSLDVIILDNEIAEEYGMLEIYEKNGVSESFMEDAIKLNEDMMIERIASMLPKLQMVFVKYFAEQVNKDSEYTQSVGKHYAIENYLRNKYALDITIRDISEQLKKEDKIGRR